MPARTTYHVTVRTDLEPPEKPTSEVVEVDSADMETAQREALFHAILTHRNVLGVAVEKVLILRPQAR